MSYLSHGSRRRRRPPSALGIVIVIGLFTWAAALYGYCEALRWLF